MIVGGDLAVNLGCLVLQALLEHWPPTFVNSGKTLLIPSLYVLTSVVLVTVGFM